MRIFHVSDLHFGRPAVPEQIDAIEELIQKERFDVVAISGDVSQRARAGEFLRARSFIRDAQRVSQTIIVPGNHDVRWWHAPLGIGDENKMYEGYRTYIAAELEPVLRVPGATFVGVNTCHGIQRQTLTWNLRDLSIIGYVTKKQIDRTAAEFAKSTAGEARIIVMHHNPVKGELSQRHGLRNTKKVLGAFAEQAVDVVLCGHDHQEAIHYVEHTKKGTVISTAGTVSSRSRGGRPSSLNVIRIDGKQIEVTTHVWSREQRAFQSGSVKCFTR